MSANMERSALGYIGLLITAIFPIYLLVTLFQSIANGSDITIYVLISFLFLLILFSLPFIILFFDLFRQYSIKLTDVGLTRKDFGNSVVVLWDEVQNVTIKFYALTLQTNKKKYVINLLLFKYPKEIVEFVVENVNIKTT